MSEYETRQERAAIEAEFDRLDRERDATSEAVSAVLSVRFRGDELAMVEQAAEDAGMKLSTFIRKAALTTANPLDMRAASEHAEAIATEVHRLIEELHGKSVA